MFCENRSSWLYNKTLESQLHREFIRAGTDIVQAFTYYGHREKLRLIGKEDLLEPLQKNALQIAKDARDEFKDLDLLVCGDVANTNIYNPDDKKSHIECQKMYEEQVGWAKEAGVDFIVAETINWTGEMKIALKAIKDAGMIAVTNFSIKKGDKTREGHTPGDACKIMEDLGADVVGLNCYRGPAMTMKLLPEIRKKVSCHVAALPVPYRTQMGSACDQMESVQSGTSFHAPANGHARIGVIWI